MNSTGAKKRFYKEVSVVQDNGVYELSLDGRKLKTPKGSVFKVRNRLLALAIETEWQSQKDLIRLDQMHLTSLMNTCIDNPVGWTVETLSASILEYLMTDTLCFRSHDPEELRKLEEKLWNPVVEWFMNYYNVDLVVTTSLFSTPVPESTRAVLHKHLLSHPFEALVAVNFMTESLKSAILSSAVLNRKVSVEEAIRLSRLETEYQVAKWGKFATHDAEEVQLRARVSAAALFAYFHTNFLSETRSKVK